MTFDCDEVIQLLTDYVDGELDSTAKIGLEVHFSNCKNCDAFLKTFQVTIKLTGYFSCEEIPPDVSERLHNFLAARIHADGAGPESPEV
jgi:anti-sigma factor RsiW